MPIYEYQCQKCETVFETIVSNTSPSEITCEKCGSSDLRKLMSAIGIHVSDQKIQPTCQPKGGFS